MLAVATADKEGPESDLSCCLVAGFVVVVCLFVVFVFTVTMVRFVSERTFELEFATFAGH